MRTYTKQFVHKFLAKREKLLRKLFKGGKQNVAYKGMMFDLDSYNSETKEMEINVEYVNKKHRRHTMEHTYLTEEGEKQREANTLRREADQLRRRRERGSEGRDAMPRSIRRRDGLTMTATPTGGGLSMSDLQEAAARYGWNNPPPVETTTSLPTITGGGDTGDTPRVRLDRIMGHSHDAWAEAVEAAISPPVSLSEAAAAYTAGYNDTDALQRRVQAEHDRLEMLRRAAVPIPF